MSSKYTFKRETTVVLEYGDTLYYLDALGDFTHSQTFEKRRVLRKTLHNKTPKPSTLVMGKNPGSGSMSVYATDNHTESVLLTLIGLQKTLKGYELPFNMGTEPKYFNMYFVSNSETTKLEQCALETLDFGFSRARDLIFEVSFAYSNFKVVPGGLVDNSATLMVHQLAGSVVQGNVPATVNTLSIDILSGDYVSYDFEGIKSTQFSLQQTFTWREDNNIQTIGDKYFPKRAILEDMPINAVISAYYNSTSSVPDTLDHEDIRIIFGSITITITNTSLTRRLAVQDILEVHYDLSLQESSSVVVEYGEL